MERSGQHWLMDSTQGLSLALNDLLTVQTENLDLIWLPCDQHDNAIFRNALGQMNNNDKSKKITFSLALRLSSTSMYCWVAILSLGCYCGFVTLDGCDAGVPMPMRGANSGC